MSRSLKQRSLARLPSSGSSWYQASHLALQSAGKLFISVFVHQPCVLQEDLGSYNERG